MSVLSPIANAAIKSACLDIYESTQKDPSLDEIKHELRKINFPVTENTGRLIQSYLSDTYKKDKKELIQKQKDKDKDKQKENNNNNNNNEPLSKKVKLSSSLNTTTDPINNNIVRTVTNVNPYLTSRPNVTFKDIAGISSIIDKLKDIIFKPIFASEIYDFIGNKPNCTILLCGPSG